MAIKTKDSTIYGTVNVWAIPKPSYVIEVARNTQEEGFSPFDYEIRTDTCWQNGAVKLFEKEISLKLPAGIDLLHAALTTLKDQKKEILVEAEERCSLIDKQIQELALLEYVPEKG